MISPDIACLQVIVEMRSYWFALSEDIIGAFIQNGIICSTGFLCCTLKVIAGERGMKKGPSKHTILQFIIALPLQLTPPNPHSTTTGVGMFYSPNFHTPFTGPGPNKKQPILKNPPFQNEKPPLPIKASQQFFIP
ncbi:MAG: hypothetical protein ACTHMC_00300 [Pseudobacter sp.]|uniref:hypothetical protein n=1 Tax=Pseudobacter sp. TaxID=2045420 RepID=UPI003F7F822E